MAQTLEGKAKESPPEMSGDFEETDFIMCSKCDGHQACEDFGCAYELGLGRMVNKNINAGYDDWD